MIVGSTNCRSLLILLVTASLAWCRSGLAEEDRIPFDEKELYEHLDRYESNQYCGLRYVLNDHQKMDYLTTPTRKERDEWLIKFWKMNDPTPTTRKNERRLEHEQRVDSALERFYSPEFPGWDCRGEILIRFGEPDMIQEVSDKVMSSAENPKEEFDFNMPGELWHYYSLNMVVPFEEATLNGEHIYYLDLATIEDREMTEFTRRFTKNGGGPAMYQVSEGHSRLTESRTYSSSNLFRMNFASTPELLNFYSNLENNRYAHSVDIKCDPLDCYFDITSFDGGNGKLRTEVNFEIHAEDLSYKITDTGFKTDFEVRVKVFDMDMKEIVSGEDSIEIELPILPQPDSHWLLPAQCILTLDPGYYRFGLEISDLRNHKHGSVLVSRYIAPMGDTLSVSDIQLASTINPSWNRTIFIKGHLHIVPHPIHAYKRPDPVKFYFEIYGLLVDQDDIGIFEVEYEVEPKDKRRKGPVFQNIAPIVSSTIESSGFGSTQQVYLEIDSRNLWESNFRLRVRVMDRRTRKSIETMTSFSILD